MYLRNISLIYSKVLRIIQDDNIRIIKKPRRYRGFFIFRNMLTFVLTYDMQRMRYTKSLENQSTNRQYRRGLRCS